MNFSKAIETLRAAIRILEILEKQHLDIMKIAGAIGSQTTPSPDPERIGNPTMWDFYCVLYNKRDPLIRGLPLRRRLTHKLTPDIWGNEPVSIEGNTYYALGDIPVKLFVKHVSKSQFTHYAWVATKTVRNLDELFKRYGLEWQ